MMRVRFVSWDNSNKADCLAIDDILGTYVLNAQQSSEFNYEMAINRLVSLDLRADDAPSITFISPEDDLACERYGMGRQGRLMRLAGWIDLHSKLTVILGPYRLLPC